MSSRSHTRCALTFAAVAALLAGCPAGQGEGWVGGSVYVQNCSTSGDSLDQAQDNYELNATFFAGDPVLDFNEVVAERRSTVTVRVQETSNRAEESDGLVLQFGDVAAAARAFAQRQLIGASSCFDLSGRCASANSVYRAQFNLYNSCPSNRSLLTASTHEIVRGPAPNAPGECLLPPVAPPPAQPALAACPTLSDADRAALDKLCEGDFNDRAANEAEVVRLLGQGSVFNADRTVGHACLYLCTFGEAQRGQDPNELLGFHFDYGDRLSALFYLNFVDARAMTLGECSRARAQIAGMISFEMVRSRAAQSFP
ncbi:MAG: hypothetical protein KC503_47170 [Myxococcales bacterium]|nr:hypothetical protein [Myxococcales bacterium]